MRLPFTRRVNFLLTFFFPSPSFFFCRKFGLSTSLSLAPFRPSSTPTTFGLIPSPRREIIVIPAEICIGKATDPFTRGREEPGSSSRQLIYQTRLSKRIGPRRRQPGSVAPRDNRYFPETLEASPHRPFVVSFFLCKSADRLPVVHPPFPSPPPRSLAYPGEREKTLALARAFVDGGIDGKFGNCRNCRNCESVTLRKVSHALLLFAALPGGNIYVRGNIYPRRYLCGKYIYMYNMYVRDAENIMAHM